MRPFYKKMIEEAAYHPLLNPAKALLRYLNEGQGALHCIPRIAFEVFNGLSGRRTGGLLFSR